jgi:hypothetical protein
VKLLYKDLFDVRAMLGFIWELPLPGKLFMKMRRLDKTVNDELALFEPERMKLIMKHQKGIVNNNYVLPQKPGDDGFEEFVKDQHEVFGMVCDKEIAWENEPVAPIEKLVEESKDPIIGKSAKALLDLIESFNHANDELKTEPVAVAVDPVTV